MIYSTKQTKTVEIFKKAIKVICIAAFWIFVWEAASRIVSRNNNLLILILPSPFTVFKKWFELAFTQKFLTAEFYTLARIFLGFISGVVLGFLFGILTHISKTFSALISPILKIIRAIPVVAIIILLYLFFNSSTLPVIIVSLMVMPIIWQTVHDGLNNTDIRLIEMGNVFLLPNTKILFRIKIPQIIPNLITSVTNALGLAWKSGVAAEVICLPKTSLGTILWQSKGNVNYDEVYAVTLTVVVLSIIIEFFIKYLCKKYISKNGGNQND